MELVQDTDAQKINEIFEKQKVFQQQVFNSSASTRITKLNKIYKYLDTPTHREELIDALRADLRKPRVESLTAEIGVVMSSIKKIRKNLRLWMRTASFDSPLLLTGATSQVRYEPKGKALIIAPWNYPFQLSMDPLMYAIAAGCTAVVKPSEFTPATSAFITKMISSIFSEEEISIIQGGIPTSQALLSLPFDHIFFTGSPAVGKIVMGAAAKHLTSVTLELGGKSPCIIDEKVNIDKMAKRLAWGKYFNMGQTCIAPDYVLVPKNKQEQLVQALKKHTKALFDDGQGFQASPSLGRIVNEKHFDRIKALLDDATSRGGKVEMGGAEDRSDKFIEPTILTNLDLDADILAEEIFGPLMPIVPYNDLNEAFSIIKSKPKPLALYILSTRNKFIKNVMENTTAGGTVINDFLIHFTNHNLPIGGVNNSGIGKSHGRHGFIAFSNERSVMRNRFLPTQLFYPPYSKFTERIANMVGKWI